MNSTSPPLRRTSTRGSAKELSGVSGALACAMTCSSSSSAVRYWTSSLTLPLLTLRYGVSMKPNALMRA